MCVSVKGETTMYFIKHATYVSMLHRRISVPANGFITPAQYGLMVHFDGNWNSRKLHAIELLAK